MILVWRADEELCTVVLFFLPLLFLGMNGCAYDCMYPVAPVPGLSGGGEEVYVICQKGEDQLDLWRWNPDTDEAELALLTRFNPARVCILPEGAGFSFIDNGLLKVKLHSKRSPKVIAFDIPLYDIQTVVWISQRVAVMCALYRGKRGIFRITIDGDVTPILWDTATEYSYPQLMDGMLWYICYKDGEYSIQYVQWGELGSKAVTVFSDFKPLGFLKMQDRRGLFLSYPTYVLPSRAITCAVFGLSQKKGWGGWQADQLFSFSIPQELVMTCESKISSRWLRLYESLYPCLPIDYSEFIIFFDLCGSFVKPFVFHKYYKVIVPLFTDEFPCSSCIGSCMEHVGMCRLGERFILGTIRRQDRNTLGDDERWQVPCKAVLPKVALTTIGILRMKT